LSRQVESAYMWYLLIGVSPLPSYKVAAKRAD
jgi:hypothetical protein